MTMLLNYLQILMANELKKNKEERVYWYTSYLNDIPNNLKSSLKLAILALFVNDHTD